MTTVRLLRRPATGPVRVAGELLRASLICLVSGAPLLAQGPTVHWQHRGVMPPGAIGGLRLGRGGPLSGYFQPVAIHVPQGALVSVAVDGRFDQPEPTPVQVGMLIAPVYRLRVTQVPNYPGMEVFPTVEIIDRLYPPPGEALRFPIPIVISAEELELALEGKFVTRVIYVEDPDRALPVAQRVETQNWFEVEPDQDPLEMADRLGRPVAILRLGGRLPGDAGPDQRFLHGSPPLRRHEISPTPPGQPNGAAKRRRLQTSTRLRKAFPVGYERRPSESRSGRRTLVAR